MTYRHQTRITYSVEHTMAWSMFMRSRIDRAHVRTMLEHKLGTELAEQGLEVRPASQVHELFVLVPDPAHGDGRQKWVPFTDPDARGDLVKYVCSTAYVHPAVDATPIGA